MKTGKLITGLLLAGGISSVGAGIAVYNPSNAVEVNAATTDVSKEESVKTGFIKVDGKYKYIGIDGVEYTGWHYMTEKEGEKTPHWSYFGDDGWLRTGWQKMGTAQNPDSGNKVHYSYFGNNGWLRTGWQKFGKGTNQESKEATHYSYFGKDGWLRTGWQKMGTSANPDTKNQAHWSYFGNNGWMQTGWKHFNATKSEAAHDAYFGSNGWAVVSKTIKIKGYNYKFNAKGWMVSKELPTVASISEVNTSGWSTGKASAYGGSTDSNFGGTTTANGSKVTNSSMGVAIPMAWGRKDLLGHKVMIAYGNKVVTATINDVGGMGGGSRALDLQPGVFKAFGFSSCNGWGVRTVKYKIL